MNKSFLFGYQRTVSTNGSRLNDGKNEPPTGVDVFEMTLDYFGGRVL